MSQVAVKEQTLPRPAKNKTPRWQKMGITGYIALGIVTFLSIFPFYWMFVVASSGSDEISKIPPSVVPGPRFLKVMADVYEAVPFNQALLTNVVATHALLAGFDQMLRRAKAGRIIGLTSSVAAAPRPYWGAYGATKAAFDNLLATYAAEVERLSPLRVAIVDPGATRTEMRARAYPGEDPMTVKPPEVVADRLVALLIEGFDGLHRERIEPA